MISRDNERRDKKESRPRPLQRRVETLPELRQLGNKSKEIGATVIRINMKLRMKSWKRVKSILYSRRGGNTRSPNTRFRIRRCSVPSTGPRSFNLSSAGRRRSPKGNTRESAKRARSIFLVIDRRVRYYKPSRSNRRGNNGYRIYVRYARGLREISCYLIITVS